MDLFDYMRETKMESEAPLASRIRPRTLDEIVGQQHILAKDKLLYRAIKADKLSSVIFYGPPGTGKTTIAKVIAGTTSAAFTQINATVAGKKNMERRKRENPGLSGIPVLLGSELSRHAHLLRRAVLRGHLLFVHRRCAGSQLCRPEKLHCSLE